MKQNIKLGSVTLSQNQIIDYKLKPQHLFLIDYLNQFFCSGKAKYVTKRNKKDKYYYITTNKILDDLPFLDIKKRRLQELLKDLETAKIIKRFAKNKCCPMLHIKLNLEEIIAL